MSAAASSSINLVATPLRNGMAEGRDAVIDILVRVQAPDAPAETSERSPLELALVIDRSGSMSGEPLDEAKRCAEMIVDHLGPKDRIALVHFGSDVVVAAPTQAVTNRSALKASIGRIACDGMTALHGGWLKGAEMIAERSNATAIARVLLLSDGCANEGLTDPGEISAQADALRKAGVSTSTYGVRRGFDERLMTLMATSGGGNAYYGKTAQDLLGSFREEFDLLSALCARNVRLKLRPAAGVMLEVLNEYPRDGAAWRLPDLAYEGEAWAMLRATADAETVAALEGQALVEITASAVDLEGRPLVIAPTELTIPVRTPEAYEGLQEDGLVKERLQEMEAMQLQRNAQAAAERGDWAEVDSLIATASERFEGNDYLARSLDIAKGIAETRDVQQLKKEVSYRASRRMTGLRARRSFASFSLETERELPSFLRRKLEEGVSERDEEPKKPKRRDAG